MPEGKDNGSVHVDDRSTPPMEQTGDSDRGGNNLRNAGFGRGGAGGRNAMHPTSAELRPSLEAAAADYPSPVSAGGWESFVEQVKRDANQIPPSDPKATRLYPRLQECVRRVRDSKNRPRAGGEIKTVAKGSNYYSTLVMPEEGVQVSVVHNALSSAWEALEQTLNSEPVPWVECSEFATRRAKQKGLAKQEKS